MRGFGATQPPVAHEQQMDELAKKLNMDPYEFRRKNLLAAGEQTVTGQVLSDSVPVKSCLDSVKERVDSWEVEKWKKEV